MNKKQQTAITPKEKAEELVNKYFNPDVELRLTKGERKQCALIAIDEIIDAIDWHEYEVPNDQLKYWFEVKREIQKT